MAKGGKEYSDSQAGRGTQPVPPNDPRGVWGPASRLIAGYRPSWSAGMRLGRFDSPAEPRAASDPSLSPRAIPSQDAGAQALAKVRSCDVCLMDASASTFGKMS